MDLKDIRYLEELLKYEMPSTYFAELYRPRPARISKQYVDENTVVPLDSKIIGGYEYCVKIKPEINKRGASSLIVSLFEKELIGGNQKKVSVSVPLTRKGNTALVNRTAILLAEEYKESNYTSRAEILDRNMLRQLIAGRVEYYMRGGSSQNLTN